MRETVFVKTLREDVLLSELSDQNLRHLPNCYPVVADRAQAMRATGLMMQEYLIPSRLFGRPPHLK